LPGDEPAAPGATRHLAADDADRVRRVLRLRDGEQIQVADSTGAVHAARVRHGDLIQVEELLRAAAAPAPVTVRLALAGARADTAIEKLVELGVECVGPLITEQGRHQPREARWRRVAAAAAEQAQRPRRARIAPAQTFPDALSDGALVFCPEDPDGDVDQALARLPLPVTLLIGPEAGFSVGERAAARRASVPIASLGSVLLRSETASIVAATLVLDRLGGLR
jgi:16S rRNA (uracil1498-N3)-methyltransferase